MAKKNRASMIAVAVVLPLASACSVMMDRDIVQCSTDLDCAKFETGDTAHAICNQGICVNSGLGPKGCFYGPPSTTAEYLNACTSAQTLGFDNCARLGLCGPAAVVPDPLPPVSAGTLTATIKPVTPPALSLRRYRAQRDLHGGDVRLWTVAQERHATSDGRHACVSSGLSARNILRWRE